MTRFGFSPLLLCLPILLYCFQFGAQVKNFEKLSEVPGGGLTGDAPFAIEYHSALWLYGVGTDHKVYENVLYPSRSGYEHWQNWRQTRGYVLSASGVKENFLSAGGVVGTVYRNKIYLFGIGASDYEFYVWDTQVDRWNEYWTRVPGGKTSWAEAAATVYRDKLYLFGVDRVDKGFYMKVYDADTERWNEWTEVPGGRKTNRPPVALEYRDKIFLFGVGIDDTAIYVNIFDGGQWSGWAEVPGGGKTNRPLAATVYRESITLFAIGHSSWLVHDNLYNWEYRRWSGWMRLYPDIKTSVAPAVAVHNNNLYLFAIGFDRKFYVTFRSLYDCPRPPNR